MVFQINNEYFIDTYTNLKIILITLTYYLFRFCQLLFQNTLHTRKFCFRNAVKRWSL